MRHAVLLFLSCAACAAPDRFVSPTRGFPPRAAVGGAGRASVSAAWRADHPALLLIDLPHRARVLPVAVRIAAEGEDVALLRARLILPDGTALSQAGAEALAAALEKRPAQRVREQAWREGAATGGEGERFLYFRLAPPAEMRAERGHVARRAGDGVHRMDVAGSLLELELAVGGREQRLHVGLSGGPPGSGR